MWHNLVFETMASFGIIIWSFVLFSAYSVANCAPGWLDMTYPYEVGMISLRSPFERKVTFEGRLKNAAQDIPYIVYHDVSFPEHIGTHMDAPSHVAKGKKSIDQISTKDFMAEAIVVDVSAKAAKDRGYNLTVGDLKRWEWKHGRIPKGCVVFAFFDWGKFYGNDKEYIGTSTKNPKELSWPAISPKAARWLVKYRGIKGIGTDAFAVEFPQNRMFDTHQILADNNLYGLEKVANVDKLPTRGAKIFAFPMKIKGGSGAPVRILAQLPSRLYSGYRHRHHHW